MLRTIQTVLGYTLQATDKNLGAVKDFYFDDHRWIVRYLIADTGNWLPGRHVLLGTESLGKPNWNEGVFPINLTSQQIEDSPDIQDDAPVSIQQEEKLRAYFSWQRYWGDTPFIQPAAGATFGLVGVASPARSRTDCCRRRASCTNRRPPSEKCGRGLSDIPFKPVMEKSARSKILSWMTTHGNFTI